MDLELVTKCRPHACEQLIHSEWFGHIVIGTEIKRLNLTGFVTSARQHHNRNAFVSCTDRSQQLVSLNIRETEIENDQVRSLAQEFKGSFAVGRLENLITLCGQAHP